ASRVRAERLLLGLCRPRRLALRLLRRAPYPLRRSADRLEAVRRPARLCLAVRRGDPLRYAPAQLPPLGRRRNRRGGRFRHLLAGLLSAPGRESALSTDQRRPPGVAARHGRATPLRP